MRRVQSMLEGTLRNVRVRLSGLLAVTRAYRASLEK